MRAMHRLRYFAADAWDEWRHSPGVNLLALGTLSAALFLGGVIMLMLSNVERNVHDQRRDVPLEVYLRDEIGAAEQERIRDVLESDAGVIRVDYVGKQEALQRYREWSADRAELIGELQDNPLPASFEAFLDPGPGMAAAVERLIGQLEGMPGVDEASFDSGWVERLQALVDSARLGGIGLLAVVFGTVAIVIGAVLRLAVYARRDEISIMLLVGATRSFVRGPFLVAGVALGLAASLIALGLVELLRRLVLSYAGAGALLVELSATRPLPPIQSSLLVLLGLLVSLVGSYFAVRVEEE